MYFFRGILSFIKYSYNCYLCSFSLALICGFAQMQKCNFRNWKLAQINKPAQAQKISCKYFENIVKYCENIVEILWKHFENIVKIFWKYCELAQTQKCNFRDWKLAHIKKNAQVQKIFNFAGDVHSMSEAILFNYVAKQL